MQVYDMSIMVDGCILRNCDDRILLCDRIEFYKHINHKI